MPASGPADARVLAAHLAPVSVAGLWWVHGDGTVEVKKKAQVRRYPEPLPQKVVQAVAWRATDALRSDSVALLRGLRRELAFTRKDVARLSSEAARSGISASALAHEVQRLGGDPTPFLR